MGTPQHQEEDDFSCSCLKKLEEEKMEVELCFLLGAADLRQSLKSRFLELTGGGLRSSPAASVRMVEVVRTAEQLGPNPKAATATVLRRESAEEQVLVLFRRRPGHTCARAIVAVAVAVWQGVEREICSGIYRKLAAVVPKYGNALNHRYFNGANCRCQEMDFTADGTRFNFGYTSPSPNAPNSICLSQKRDLSLSVEEEESCDLYDVTQFLADRLAHVYRRFAPKCFHRQIKDCNVTGCRRLGNATDGQPFNGVTYTVGTGTAQQSHKAPKNIGPVMNVMLNLSESSGGIRGVKQLCLRSYRLVQEDHQAATTGQYIGDTSGGLSIECLHGSIVFGSMATFDMAHGQKVPGRICASFRHVPTTTTSSSISLNPGKQLKEIATTIRPVASGSERKPKQPPKPKKKAVESSSPTDLSSLSSDNRGGDGESAAMNRQSGKKKRKLIDRKERRKMVKVPRKQQCVTIKKPEAKFAGFDSDA